ncbi:MAG TPA: hypothetical protein VJ728_03420 [Candidatus Binataceae bacterium]|nr:hypothetical protein [Candidatus Binataceae bacterium]
MRKSENRTRTLNLPYAVSKVLADLEAKPFKQVAMTILRLLENATPSDSAELKGFSPYRRVDIGERRIIYHFDEQTVYIAHVGKRNDSEVYRFLKR